MSQQTQGLRLRRTQKLLREALIELIEEQGFESLTVGEIAERALVSRAAFYRNYRDKYDLVERIFDEAMQALFDAVSKPGGEHPPQLWVKFFEHITEYERLYHALLGRKGSPWFVQKMRVSMMDLVKGFQRLAMGQAATDRPAYSDPDGFVANLVATMLVEAITWWLEKGKPYSPEEMTSRCTMLATAIFNETNTW
jgi:AcrR family transcriptional regulator